MYHYILMSNVPTLTKYINTFKVLTKGVYEKYLSTTLLPPDFSNLKYLRILTGRFYSPIAIIYTTVLKCGFTIDC